MNNKLPGITEVQACGATPMSQKQLTVGQMLLGGGVSMWAFCVAMAVTGPGPFLRGAAVMSAVFLALIIALPKSIRARRVSELPSTATTRYLCASLALLLVVLLIEHFL